MTLSAHAAHSASRFSLRLCLAPALLTISLAAHCATLHDQRSQAISSSQPSSAAQVGPDTTPLSKAGQLIAASDLPDAPDAGPVAALSSISSDEAVAFTSDRPAAIGPPPPIAPLFHKYIEPGQTAQPLPTGTKILFGFHQLESPYLLLTVLAAGAYEQAVNGSPNYGTNIGAYGQRVGAAAIRDASQTIFTDGIAAPIFHQDPRFYIMGNRRNPLVRASYAVSRVLVTRADDGSTQPNYSLFAGYAGAAALNNAFYPADNRGFSETAKGFAGSLGGAAISNVVREFLPTILHTVHLER